MQSILNGSFTPDLSLTALIPNHLVKSAKKLVYRFIDPNGRFLEEESLGHFDHHKQEFLLSIQRVDQIFTTIISKEENQNKECSKIWLQHKNIFLNEEKLWNEFINPGGTCYGNCVALTEAVIKVGKALGIPQLHAIEATKAFSIQAITFQLFMDIAYKFSLEVSEILDGNRRDKVTQANLTEDQKKALGDRYIRFPLQSDLDILYTYPISFEKINRLNDDEFESLVKMVSYGITCQKIQKEIALNNIKNKKPFSAILQQIKAMNGSTKSSFLPDESQNQLKNELQFCEFLRSARRNGYHDFFSKINSHFSQEHQIKYKTFLNYQTELIIPENSSVKTIGRFNVSAQKIKEDIFEKVSELRSDTFAGVFLIDAENNQTGTGHELFLEVDNAQKLYILYDNNKGFYKFQDLDSSLKELGLKSIQYGLDIEVLPFIFSV